MLGTAPSGPMQFRGRISVVPGGHCSPGWICVPRAPPGPRFAGCCDGSELPMAVAMAKNTNVRRMNDPRRAVTANLWPVQARRNPGPRACLHRADIPVPPKSASVEPIEGGSPAAEGDRRNRREHRRRDPDPDDLTRDDPQAALGEEPPDAHWRHENRPPREEEPFVHDGREERDTTTAAGHRVEHAVRRRREKEIRPDARSFSVKRGVAERQESSPGEQRREDQRMREPAVAEHALVRNAEPVADAVDIREGRERRPENPVANRRPSGPERGAYGEPGDRVCERRRHARSVAEVAPREKSRENECGNPNYARHLPTNEDAGARGNNDQASDEV